jgi:hypothetical protein
VVVRDEFGSFVAAECGRHDLVDLETVELLACRDVMLLAKSKVGLIFK